MIYASKYYDPVKAHEYYMRTRKLKGRRLGTGSITSSRVNALRNYVQKMSPEQKKSATESIKQKIETIRNEIHKSVNDKNQNYLNKMSYKIDKIREAYFKLPEEEKAKRKRVIKKQIQAVMRENQKRRGINKEQKQKLYGLNKINY